MHLDHAVALTRSGGLILAADVNRDDRVADLRATNPSVRAIQQFSQQLAAHPALETILIPVVRQHLDGLAIARQR